MKTQKLVDEVFEINFSKNQLLSAKKYSNRRDILSMKLKDDQTYTLKQVDDLIAKFLKEKVN